MKKFLITATGDGYSHLVNSLPINDPVYETLGQIADAVRNGVTVYIHTGAEKMLVTPELIRKLKLVNDIKDSKVNPVKPNPEPEKIKEPIKEEVVKEDGTDSKAEQIETTVNSHTTKKKNNKNNLK